jgi:hypothetical protein
MSRISQDFVNNVGFLYEQIHVKDQNFLNEESEYYDEETAELTEDIILSLSLAMFSEGYTAETFVKFLVSSDEEVILEKYLSTDINFISEESIYNDFVEEQFELLEVAGLIKLLGRGAKAAASGIKAGAKATKGAVKTGVTKVATAGVESKIGKKLVTNKGPNISGPFKNVSGRTGSAQDRRTAALEKLSKRQATKAGIEVPKGSLNPTQATELIKQARTARAIKGVKTAAKYALAGGTGVLSGYMGAKLAGGGGDGKVGPKIVGPKIVGPKIVGPKSSSSSDGGGGSNSSGGGGSGGSSKPSSGVPKPAPAKPAAKTDMQKWAKANPRLAQAEKLRQQGASRQDINKVLYDKGTAASQGSGQSKMERDAEELRRMTNKSKQRQGQEMGGPEGPGKIDTKAVEADIKAAQEKEKEKLKQKSAEVAKESYEPYDVILNYLLSEGHADTLDEANYIMMEMDETAIGTIIKQYEDYLLAEEIQEWVNGLVEEGYDLSQYTWDDMVEYYVTQN